MKYMCVGELLQVSSNGIYVNLVFGCVDDRYQVTVYMLYMYVCVVLY